MPAAIAIAATGAYACFPRPEGKTITLTGGTATGGQQAGAALTRSAADTPTTAPSSRSGQTRRISYWHRATPTRGTRSSGRIPTARRTGTDSPTAVTPTTPARTTTRTSTTSTSPTRTPTTGPSTSPPTTSPSSGGSFADQVVTLTNQQRLANGCQPLTVNATLTKVAQAHSEDMARRNFFDHTNPDGRSPFDRMSAAGYEYRTAAENIAAGHRTPEAVVTGWMNSEGHRRNIVNCGLTEIGVGYVTGGSYGTYWTQDFGTPR